ncbi:MAG TPA: IPT/TIG domain-containing protein [Pyrinomonadaceae bacterium]|nr:IPT/TIG domain-containing protein [Pyrinomonadaceae bacterium]
MAQIIDKVKPGDLITAQFINRIVDEINALQAKVAGLESIGPVGGKVFITDIKPHSPPPRVNQQMHITGQNFGFVIGATEVTFDEDTRVDTYLAGSNDQNLIFTIPVIPNLPPQGKQVTVRVSNVSESAQKVVTILPVELSLEGGVDVLFKTADPLTITPGSAVTFEYSLKSRASLAADFTITTEITGVNDPAPWQSQIELLNSQKAKAQGNQIHLEVNETKTFFVRIKAVPPNTNGQKFGLKVSASSGKVGGTTGGAAEFTVGQAIDPPDPATNLLLNTGGQTPAIEFIPVSAGSVNNSTAPPTITLQKSTAQTNQVARVNPTAVIQAVGIYDVTAKITSGSGWTATVSTQTVPNPFEIKKEDFDNSGEATKPLRISIKALEAATAQAKVEIQLQRQGSSLKRTLSLLLKLPAQA